MHEPLVSVLIPTYNRAARLMAAVKSVQAQTYGAWELIVVDDASTDTTQEVMHDLSAADARIKYVRFDLNQGQSAARNRAAELAAGKYLAFLDSDDEWLPEKLAQQVSFFESQSETVALTYSGAYFRNASEGTTRIKHAVDSGDLHEKELLYNPVGGPSRVMVRTSVFKQVGGFDVSFRSHEDWDLWIRISETWSIAALDVPLIVYIESSDSMTLDPAKLVAGYEHLWQKHGILLRSRHMRAVHYCRLGHRLASFGAIREGRAYLVKAVQAEPWNPKALFLLMLSMLPSRSYRSITFTLMKTFAL